MTKSDCEILNISLEMETVSGVVNPALDIGESDSLNGVSQFSTYSKNEQVKIAVVLHNDYHEDTEKIVSEPQTEKKISSVKKWFTGTNVLVYSTHFLSAWGDRMWSFGIGLFLIGIAPESLQLTAVYGLSRGISVLFFGAIVGDWVDNTPRLKVAQLSLVLQNLFVVLCAASVYTFIWFKDDIAGMLDDWLQRICYGIIILLSILSNLFSIARVIAVERDWIVEICGRDKDKLAQMTSTLRRIDLSTKILAPIATGQIMTYAGLENGAIFIGGWNLISVFFEYFLVWKVYNAVPALKKKKDKCKSEKILEDTETEECPVAIETVGDNKQEAELNLKGNRSNSKELLDSDDSDTSEKQHSHRLQADDAERLQLKTKTGKKSQTGEKRKDDEVALSDEEQVVTTSCCGRCLKKSFQSFITLFRGWKTYISYDVSRAGLGLAFLYMTVLGFDNITVGYSYSQGISESILGILMGASALIGIAGTVVYPFLRRRVGLERTGLFALASQIACLLLCVVSIWTPGSPFDPYGNGKDSNCSNSNSEVGNETMLTTTGPSIVYSVNNSVNISTLISIDNRTHLETTSCKTEPDSYISIGLLMAGIIAARFGLWIADLAITQLFLENIVESQRGVVNGVQSSLNQLMDMLKFAMVVAIPVAHLFGFLILVSFCFICFGAFFYASYSRKARGHLFHFEKCVINNNSNSVGA